MFWVLVVFLTPTQPAFLANFTSQAGCESFRAQMAPIVGPGGQVLPTKCLPPH